MVVFYLINSVSFTIRMPESKGIYNIDPAGKTNNSPVKLKMCHFNVKKTQGNTGIQSDDICTFNDIINQSNKQHSK